MAKAKILKFDAAGPGLSKPEILKVCEAENVRFMRLQFTDIFGIIKNVEIPSSQFAKALDGEIQFDGSSICLRPTPARRRSSSTPATTRSRSPTSWPAPAQPSWSASARTGSSTPTPSSHHPDDADGHAATAPVSAAPTIPRTGPLPTSS